MSDEEDDYVSFGSALKPLEETDNIRKRPLAVEEQTVRDERGIRRFHGAFTGGFSAGHYNSVNTPQGWYPKQFKSSREKKEEKHGQRPEDFMDDEDLGAFGFAAQALKTKSNFQSNTNVPVNENLRKTAIPGGSGLLEKIVRPSTSSMGETLLTNQGWKPGQGIGPKITKKNKNSKLSSHIKTYGCALPLANNDNNEDDDEPDENLIKYKDFLFAPDEIPLCMSKPKDNFFGIGYSGLARATLGDSSVKKDFHVATNVKSKKFSISGEAFGVGADEEDDESVYNQGDLAQYDFSLPTEKEMAGKNRRESKGSRWSSKEHQTEGGCLEGFCPATSQSMINKHYPCPDIPKDWTPRRTPSSKRKSRFEPLTDNKAVVNANKNTNPSVDQRRSILNPETANTADIKVEDGEQQLVELPEFLQAETNSDGSFKPFARDQAKQTRYDQYLRCVDNNRRDALPLLQPRTMTDWEKEREKVEFERASMLFKPMKGVIGSRFVSAGDSEDADQGGEDKEGKEMTPEQQMCHAANMKMFGQLTRNVEEWHPARLLSVRFNVAQPFGDPSVTGVRTPRRETGVTNVFAGLGDKTEEGNNSVDKPVDTSEQEQAEEVKHEIEEEIVEEKPSMDLFKAIFANSDSESDSEDREESPTPEKPPNHIDTNNVPDPKVKKPWEVTEGNTLRSRAQATGIFANIDFDALNKKSPVGPTGPSGCNVNYKDINKEPSQPRLSADAAMTFAQDSVKKSDIVNSAPNGNTIADRGGLSVINQAVRTVLGIRRDDSDKDSSSENEYGPSLPPSLAMKESIVISSSGEDSVKHNKKKKDKKKKEKKKKHKKDKSIVISSDSEDSEKLKKKHKKDNNNGKKKKKRRYSHSSS